MNRREFVFGDHQRTTFDMPADGPNYPAIDGGKGFDIALGVSRRQPRAGRGGRREILVVATSNGLAWLPIPVDAQVIGILLFPVQGGLRTVDTKPQVVLLAGSDLRHGQYSLAATSKPKKDIGVFLELPIGEKRGPVVQSSLIRSPVTYSSRLIQ